MLHGIHELQLQLHLEEEHVVTEVAVYLASRLQFAELTTLCNPHL